MCGATGAQNALQASQTAFYTEATQQQTQEYGEDQEILQQMQAAYAPILAAGPNQQGYSTGELNNLNTQATEGTATDYANASKSLREAQAAQGEPLPSGVQGQQQEQLISSAANSEAQQKQQIQQQSYQQGLQQWQAAAAGLGETAGLLNPTGGSEAATGAGNAASNTANQIASENNSWLAPVLGAAGAIGTGVIGANPGGIFD